MDGRFDEQEKQLGCMLSAENGNSNALNMHGTNKNSVGVCARASEKEQLKLNARARTWIYGKYRNSK